MTPELFTHLNGDYRERACTPPPEAHLPVVLEAIEVVWKYSLVIESSVRRGDGPEQYAGVTEALRLIKEARAALATPAPQTDMRAYSEDDLRTIGRAWRTPSVRSDFEAETGLAPLATGAGLDVEAQRQSGHVQSYTERFHAWVISNAQGSSRG